MALCGEQFPALAGASIGTRREQATAPIGPFAHINSTAQPSDPARDRDRKTTDQ